MIGKISKKIRYLRKYNNFTLKDLSEKTDLSISFLSQVERGNSTLAITSLKKIADALNVSITYFFENYHENNFHVKANNQPNIKIDGCSSAISRLSGDFENRKLESILVTIEPYQEHGHEFNHPGEEFVYVLSGELTVTLNKEKFLLKKGDSIHYPSKMNHHWKNNSSNKSTVISINTPKIF